MSSLPVQISNPLLDNHFSMSEYFTGIADWDSQAVARSCTNAFSATTFMDNNPHAYLAPMTIQQDHDFLLNTFPDLFETPTVLDELDQLFYPMFNPLAQQTILSSSSSSSSSSSISFSKGETEQEKEAFTRSSRVVAAATTAHHEVKYKRRKNQHKRVVLQVTEGVSSDTWAWRKYGQKPIKGSPYPRSYYRCSSSKGCLARKQVERSLSDPEMFVITYTAEHCHDHPTRRNSLAGTTRHKFATSTTKTSSTTAAANHDTPSLPSPSLALATMEDELSRQRILKKEIREEEEEDEHNGLDIYDMILNDDFLMGFDELDKLTFGLQEAYNGDL